MNKKIIFISVLVISLLLLPQTVNLPSKATNSGGQLEVNKKVWDGSNWVNSIDTNIGNNVRFKITLKYYNMTAEEHYAYDLVVVDTLPTCLQYVSGSASPFEPTIDNNNLIWNLSSVILYHNDTYEITFNTTAISCGNNINSASATAEEYCTNLTLSGSGNATVNVICPRPGIDVEKLVWDGTCNWVKEVWAYNGTDVRFKIVVRNKGETDLFNVTVTDILPDSLIYNNNATPREPDEISNGGKILIWNISQINVSENVTIEFNATINGAPCDRDINIVNVTAQADCQRIVTDSDTAIVNIYGMCIDKEVWDEKTNKWAEETKVSQGDEVRFRITISYYGKLKLYNIKVKDVLPPCLDYANKAKLNGQPYEPDISADGKTLWWNLTNYNLTNSQSIVIEFNASAGNVSCEPCKNWVFVTAIECGIREYSDKDSATVNIECAFVADAGGPYQGKINETITITGSATGGRPPYNFAWDLDGDGQYDDATGKVVTWSWSQAGYYIIGLKVTDQESRVAKDTASVYITNDPPNKPEKPSGPTNIRAGVEVSYQTRTTDPDGDNIYYLFDWGDGSTSGWIGPFPSNTVATANHTWSCRGSYKIKVKAKDVHGSESDWSDPLSITVPRGRLLIKDQLLLRLLQKLAQRFPAIYNLILP